MLNTVNLAEGRVALVGAIWLGAMASDPSENPPDGTIWYNSTSGVYKARENGATVTLISSARLASTANGKGASLVGVEDAAGLITATTVEDAATEIAKKANAGLAAPMTFSVTLSSLANSDVVARFTPGVAGKIRKISAFVKTVVTTAAKAATLTPYIAGTTVTGGALALTSANCTPKGAKIDGSAITAANAFTSSQEITVVVSGVTTFVEGEVTICLFFDPAA